MTNKTPRVAKNRRESTTPDTRKTGKLFFFLLLLLSDGLAQRRLNRSSWFSQETAAFHTEQCTSPSLFRNLQVFTRRLQLPTHLSTPFSCLYACALKRSLSNDT